jgi:hypothetical protein
MGILKEEEWKWADEDNKADDVDVTLHLYHRGTWYMYSSIEMAVPSSTWYLNHNKTSPTFPSGQREGE